MKTMTRVAAAAAALLTLTAVDARAQLLELPEGRAAGELSAHEIRVVQLALRDQECYRGPITGRWTAATRTALQCARERTSATQPEALARALALWSADETTTRDMAGDVAPTAPTPAPAEPTPAPTPAPTPSPMPTPAPMPTPQPDSTPTPMPVPTPQPDSVPAPTPMPTPMPTPDSVPPTPTPDSVPPMPAPDSSSAPVDPAVSTGGSMLAAHLDSVVTAAESGLVGLPAERSRTLLQGLEQQLGSAGTPEMSQLGTQFATLRNQLGATPVDSAQVGRTMTELSTRIEAAVSNAPADVQSQLRRLGAALRTEGQRLSPQ